MARNTSVAAYQSITENGLLSRRRWEVYEVLYRFGPLTQLELAKAHFQHTQARNVQPRISELAALGVVEHVGFKVDEVTQQKNMLWDVNDQLPVKPMKKKSSRARILELENEVRELKLKLKGELL